MIKTLKPKLKCLPTNYVAHTTAQLRFIYSCMYYNVHGLNSGLGRTEKYVKNAYVSGHNKTKGWNSNC